MYLPRSLISHLYLQLLKNHHALSPPVLLLVALEPDALCACRILTALLKRDYIPHKIQPVSGYKDLSKAGQELVQPMRYVDGGNGGVVVCLGVGGLVNLQSLLGLQEDEQGGGGFDGVSIWVLDSRRPWNLTTIFGGYAMGNIEDEGQVTRNQQGVARGEIQSSYRAGSGGIVIFDDGDIEHELAAEREAWYALEDMPDVNDEDDSSVVSASDDDHEDDPEHSRKPSTPSRKRKSWSDVEEDGSDSENESGRPKQRRRSNLSSSIPTSPTDSDSIARRRLGVDELDAIPPSNQQSSRLKRSSHSKEPSARALKRRLLQLRRKHSAVLHNYNAQGTSYSEPISSMLYSLASELGRENNDLLWLSIIGVSSMELYGRTYTGVSLTNYDTSATFTGWMGNRGSRLRQILRDEVCRLNPPEVTESGLEVGRGHATDVIPTHARSPTDTSIRLSPEPRFLLIRHWSLYDSMLHSPYLAARLHIWSDAGRRRLHKLLAKMGVSLTQCKQSYTHMDIDLKKILRERLLHFAPMYGLEGLLPPPTSSKADREGWGFVRTWGWKACLSAVDVAVIVGAILEVGQTAGTSSAPNTNGVSNLIPSSQATAQANALTAQTDPSEQAQARFWAAYDVLLSPTSLLSSIPTAQLLHRAILRTGTSLLQKRQIRHLRAFRMAVVKDGPDVALFTNPGALTKLALWVGEAVAEVEKDGAMARVGGGGGNRTGTTPLVLACLDESRGVFVVVGLGGGGGGGGAGAADGEGDVKAGTKELRDEKRKKREAEKERKRAEKEARRAERGEDEEDDEELETESDGSANDSSDSEDDDDDDDDDNDAASVAGEDKATAKRKKKKGEGSGSGRNRFGIAFQEVVGETSARVRLDSFEHCVVEVRREDLGGFLEGLSMKAVVG